MGEAIVTFLLDKSGSMEPIRSDTIGAFNAYLHELQKGADGITFSLLQFESRAGVVTTFKNLPVANVPDLSLSTYTTGDMTPLIDASYKTIKAVEEAVTTKPHGTKVVICIQTDGMENASREHTLADLQDLIKEKSALGWQFNFMGCGIDAYAQAGKLGIAAVNTVSYNRNSAAETAFAFTASAANTALYANGTRGSTAYSDDQRAKSGDSFFDKGPGLRPAKPATIKGTTTGMKPPEPVKPIVDDVDLK